MNTKSFFDAMELLDEKYIDGALEYRKKGKRVFLKLSAAACAALVCLSAVYYFGIKHFEKLPMLQISEGSEGSGFEGYMVKDISELTDGNPWSEDTEISELPVFENPHYYEEDYHLTKSEVRKAEKFAEEMADRLGRDNVTISNNAPDENEMKNLEQKFADMGMDVPEEQFMPTEVTAENSDLTISVGKGFRTTINFKAPVALPEGYGDTDIETAQKTAAYLSEKYKDLLSFENIEIDVFGGDRDIYGEQSYSIGVFDGSGGDEERIVSYGLYKAVFYLDDNGRLISVRIRGENAYEEVGKYPIISLEEAKKLFSEGKYITTSPEKPAEEKSIEKAELVYRSSSADKYIMPYYRFYLEIPTEWTEEGVKTYAAFYVPAIEESYISNMPLWNGGFN